MELTKCKHGSNVCEYGFGLQCFCFLIQIFFLTETEFYHVHVHPFVLNYGLCAHTHIVSMKTLTVRSQLSHTFLINLYIKLKIVICLTGKKECRRL